MHNQQLKFALVFIVLGTVLGWFSHAAYNTLVIRTDGVVKEKELLKTKDVVKEIKANTSSISLSEDAKNQFINLLKNGQYEKALWWYKKNELKEAKSLFPVLLVEIEQLSKRADKKNLLQLMDVFLQEYYNNAQLLLLKANALALTGQNKKAINAYYLAKNYAADNESYLEISRKIHDYALQSHKHFVDSKNWTKSIQFYQQLIDNEPDYSFYHFSLAESFINTGKQEKAITQLQGLTEDLEYGARASEILQKLLFDGKPSGISLEKEGQHYIVNTTLSDEYEVKLLIDTGASYSSLSSYVIAQLVQDNYAQKVSTILLRTASGYVEADIYKLSKLSIGDYSVMDITVAELNLDSLNQTNTDFEGLLGMNFLNQFDFSIDQANKKLILSPKL